MRERVEDGDRVVGNPALKRAAPVRQKDDDGDNEINGKEYGRGHAWEGSEREMSSKHYYCKLHKLESYVTVLLLAMERARGERERLL